jgi:hypothetical protein
MHDRALRYQYLFVGLVCAEASNKIVVVTPTLSVHPNDGAQWSSHIALIEGTHDIDLTSDSDEAMASIIGMLNWALELPAEIKNAHPARGPTFPLEAAGEHLYKRRIEWQTRSAI